MILITEFWRQRQEDGKFEASRGYIIMFQDSNGYLKKKKKKNLLEKKRRRRRMRRRKREKKKRKRRRRRGREGRGRNKIK